jgi:hypothetical protein
MKLRYHFILAFVAGLALVSFAAESVTKVRLEMWEGCICRGPKCSRTYDQLKDERTKRMLFGTDVSVTREDVKLTPLALLRQHLAGNKLKDSADFYWKGVVYRRAAGGKPYAVHFRGALREFKLSDTKDGDLIVCYKESF